MVFGKKKNGIILDDPNAYTPAPQDVLPYQVAPPQPQQQPIQYQQPLAPAPAQVPRYPPRLSAVGRVVEVKASSQDKKNYIVAEIWIEEKLAQNLHVGQVVVMQ